MNIVAVIEWWDPLDEGRNRWMAQTLRHLAARGHRLHVLTATRKVVEPADQHGITFDEFSPHYRATRKQTRQFIAWAEQRLSLSRDAVTVSMTGLVPAGVMHTFTHPGDADAQKATLGPVVWARAAMGLKSWFAGQRGDTSAQRLRTLSHPWVRVIIEPTGETPDASSLARMPRDKVRVIRPGADPLFTDLRERAAFRATFRAALGIPADLPVFLLPLSNTWPIDQAVVFEALKLVIADLPGQGAALLVGGPTQYLSQRLAAEKGVRSRVKFAPTDGRLDALFAVADVTVCPSRRRVFSRTVLASLAMGVPVVASQLDAAAEGLERGCGVALSDPIGPAEVARAMVSLYTDRNQSATREALQKAGERVSMRHHVEALEKVLEETRGRQDGLH